MAIAAALAAAFFYALASVLQQMEAERQPRDHTLKPTLIARLATRPRWLAGLGLDIVGYVVQWVALTKGSLVVVQPLLVGGLLFALPMKARVSPYRMRGWDWFGAVLTTAALAVFLVVSRPSEGDPSVGSLTWALLLLGTGLVTVVLVVLGHGSTPRWRAMAYGTAGGIVYGMGAALTKSCSHLLSAGVGDLFSSWQPYVLALVGLSGLILAQSAFQAGPLDASLPTLSATDPVVSVLVGAVAFNEALRSGTAATLLEVVSFSAVIVGIFMLAHTDAVNAAQGGNYQPLAHAGQST